MIGQTVGRYRILDVLGAGESGTVYRAEDLRRHRLVALKIFSPELAGDPAFGRRLDREMEAAARLNHPGIPAIHEQGRFESIRFIALQLVEGETLEARLKREPVPLPEAVQIACETAEALAAAHRAGVIHRDLNPACIILTGGGVKVLGFGQTPPAEGEAGGVAGAGGPGPESRPAGGGPAGLPPASRGAYLSPEQIRGLPADARSDLHALGAILYELATGRRPFGGESPAAIRQAILTGSPEDPGQLRAGLPRSLEQAIGWALERDPARRPGSAGELLIRLREAGRDLNALTLARSPLPHRRRRHFGTLLPTVATILLLVIVWLIWHALKGMTP